MPFRLNSPLVSAAGPLSAASDGARLPRAERDKVQLGLEAVGEPGAVPGDRHVVDERAAGSPNW